MILCFTPAAGVIWSWSEEPREDRRRQRLSVNIPSKNISHNEKTALPLMPFLSSY
jgi:hypothetical protein